MERLGEINNRGPLSQFSFFSAFQYVESHVPQKDACTHAAAWGLKASGTPSPSKLSGVPKFTESVSQGRIRTWKRGGNRGLNVEGNQSQ